MMGNIPGMSIVSKNIYLDIFIVGNIQLLENVKITLIDKTDATFGLNVEDCV